MFRRGNATQGCRRLWIIFAITRDVIECGGSFERQRLSVGYSKEFRPEIKAFVYGAA